LSVVLGLVVVLAVPASLLFVSSFISDTGVVKVTDQELSKAKAAVTDALGDKATDVEVRRVKVIYDGAPFPVSLLGGGDEQVIYVSYQLKDSGVRVAGRLGGPYGSSVAGSGLLPTVGSLESRMTPEQYDRLVAGYAANTKEPLGMVRRYSDRELFAEEGTPAGAEVTLGNKVYKTRELWWASEGDVIEGDTYEESIDGEPSVNALIFHEDPKTGAFVYLGTEPVEMYW
jgi:hypothetical protein